MAKVLANIAEQVGRTAIAGERGRRWSAVGGAACGGPRFGLRPFVTGCCLPCGGGSS
jgi:hypothetical protein